MSVQQQSHTTPTTTTTTTTTRLLIYALATTICCGAVLGADAFEFNLVRSTTTDACISFRSSDTAQWGYVNPSMITQRSAEKLCQVFYPSAATGVITNSHWGCIGRSSSYRYSTSIDCYDKNLPTSSCNVTGDMNPVQMTTSYGGAGISCIRVPAWSMSSSYSLSGTSPIVVGGVFGQPVSRTISLQSDINSLNIRPNSQFSTGTICLATPPPAEQNPKGTNIANALCRTAGLHGSIKSTIENGTTSNSALQRYVSNVVCDNEPGTTLWDSGCTFDTHYYNDPQSTCSDAPPRVSCPITFDMKLSDLIVAPFDDYNAFQLVQLRPEGTETYNGIMCVYSSYTANFANVICNELYGDDVDFAFAYTAKGPSLPLTTKEYLSTVLCPSNTNTSLSSCTATVTTKTNQYPCSTNRGMVSCKVSVDNIIFSLAKGLSSDAPGTGRLKAIVTTTSETVARDVCIDGFDQTAATAACRSVGYTPGPDVTFSSGGSAFTHTINNVTCPSGANKLTDCKLQYSGKGYKIPNSVQQLCTGWVNIDCDIGTPKVEFRMSENKYLQARLYADAEWGWVKVDSAITSTQGYNALCQHSTSNTGNITIAKTFLSVISCSSYPTSLIDCKYQYLNGDALKRSFYCNAAVSPTTSSSPGGGPSNSGEEEGVDGGMSFGTKFGLAMGISMGLVFAVTFGVIGYCVFCRKPKDSNNDGTSAERRNDDASSSGHGELHVELSSNPLPEPSSSRENNIRFTTADHTQHGGGGIYGGNRPQNTTTTTFSRFNNGGAPQPTGGVQFHAATPPTHSTYPQPQTGNYNQQYTHPPDPYQHQQQPQFGGGGIYHTQPVMGTPFVAPSPSYPLGVPAAATSSSSHPHYEQPSCKETSCTPAPYGRGNYGKGCE